MVPHRGLFYISLHIVAVVTVSKGRVLSSSIYTSLLHQAINFKTFSMFDKSLIVLTGYV